MACIGLYIINWRLRYTKVNQPTTIRYQILENAFLLITVHIYERQIQIQLSKNSLP